MSLIRQKVIIDTDVGIGIPSSDIDDGLALILALKSPELEVEAITTVSGNVSVGAATNSALNLLELLGIEYVPVAMGASKSLLGDIKPIREAYSHALIKNNLRTPQVVSQPKPSKSKSVPDHAIDLIISKVMQYPNEITLIAIGPLTNIAMAIRKEPQINGNIKELIIMGGAATVLPHCITPVAEFNMYIDPEAAKIVFHSGIPITLVGFDVTMKVFLTKEYLNMLKSYNSLLGNYIVEQAKPWITFLQRLFPLRPEFRYGCPLHDPLAVAIAIDHELVKRERMYVDIETKGELTRGQVVADRGWAVFPPIGLPNVDVCIDVNTKRFMEILISRITS